MAKIVNISSFEYNAVGAAGFLTIAWDDGIDEVIENKADADQAATDGKAVSSSTTGTITAESFAVLSALTKGDKQTMEFVGTRVGDDKTVTVTIAKTMLEKVSSNLEHAGEGGVSLTFRAFWANGQTSPVSIVVEA